MNKHDFYFGIYLICTLLCAVIDGLNVEFYFFAYFLPVFAILALYHFIAKWIIWFTSTKKNNKEDKSE